MYNDYYEQEMKKCKGRILFTNSFTEATYGTSRIFIILTDHFLSYVKSQLFHFSAQAKVLFHLGEITFTKKYFKNI